MATFRDNKQVLYGIFQYVLTTTNSPQNNITITEENITELLHNKLKAMQYKNACFYLPILTMHIFQRIE